MNENKEFKINLEFSNNLINSDIFNTFIKFNIEKNKESLNIKKPFEFRIIWESEMSYFDQLKHMVNNIFNLEKKFISLPDIIYFALRDNHLNYYTQVNGKNFEIIFTPDEKFLPLSKEFMNSLNSFGILNDDNFNFDLDFEFLFNDGINSKLVDYIKYKTLLTKSIFNKGYGKIKINCDQNSSEKIDKFLNILDDKTFSTPYFSLFKNLNLNMKINFDEKDIEADEFKFLIFGYIEDFFTYIKILCSGLDDQSNLIRKKKFY